IAFDHMRNRIGYGKGFYDRYIKAHPDMDTMGIAFDIQILEQIQTEECDQPLDMVITETLTL
ncbi:MAG: 5-formyltetrahydrofolate cyclo-ligase, partial [Lachnospiraceae bacterium]